MAVRLRIKILLIFAIFLIGGLFLSGMIEFSGIISFFLPQRKVTPIKSFSFSNEDSLKEWDKKILNKKVSYKIESFGGESYVRAVSNRSCSALYHKIKLDICKQPVLSWKWRINNFPVKKSPDNLSSREEDDFAARLYVIFPALFFSSTKVLEYIWAENVEAGTVSSSPYSDNIKLIVAESGLREGNEWVTEERYIYEDYIAAFKSKPKLKIGAIAFMCDSDSTKSSADACFDEIKIFYKQK